MRPGLGITFGALALAVFALFAQEPEKGPEFLRPLNESILESPTIQVVARTGADAKLSVDGQSVTAASPAKGVLAATLKLSPGTHELSLSSGQKIQVFVAGKTPPPAGWKVFRTHPPAAPSAAQCETCHTLQQQTWAPKAETTAASCIACHSVAKFPVKHTHTVDILEECQLCHMPHGSAASSHLKFSKEIACKQCHG